MKALALAGLVFALCFAQAGAQVPPQAFGHLYGSTGNTTITTGSPYKIFPCGSPSTNCTANAVQFQTGTSIGPHQIWLVTVTLYLSVATASTGNPVSICARTGAPITVLDAATSGVNTCAAVPTGSQVPFMGGPAFASNNSANGNFSQKLIGHVTIANNTLFTVQCLVGSANPVAVYGYCAAEAQMY